MKEIIEVGGIRTEAFILRAKEPVSDITLVVVPGESDDQPQYPRSN
jgi:hypothetical protein